MNTTITINGTAGSRLLEVLGAEYAGRMPPVLAAIVKQRIESLEVETDLAEEVARFVEKLGIFVGDEPPLLFSPNVGDGVSIVRDVLVEFQAPARRAPRIWRFVPRGTKGRLIAHQGDTDRVLLEPSREIAYVRPQSMTGTRFLRH